MITSKKKYKEYLKQDKLALGMQNLSFKDKCRMVIAPNYILKYQTLLRKVEYYGNTRSNLLDNVYYYFLRLKFKKMSLRLGFSIPENVFGPGLSIVHYGTIIINVNAKIGENCRIHASTNIGASGGRKEAPQIGDNVYIGPGSVIFGDIKIGNNIAIGANSTVSKSFIENNIVIAGNPAKKIKEFDIKKLIRHI